MTFSSFGPVAWVLFGTLVVAMLIVDLRSAPGAHVGFRAAALRCVVWITVGLGFGLAVYVMAGSEAGLAYWAAYLLEQSLSVDNLFVFVLVFSYFGLPPSYQPRVLLWGILGALAMRAAFIAAGVALLARFHWVIYPFAGLLLVAAVRFLRGRETGLARACCETGPTWVSRIIPVVPRLYDGKFLARENGALVATPLFAALISIESADLVFALDSIPAVLGITRDPFLVYTSNIFALLGLRSLYFVLATALGRLRYLRYGLALILAFVAARMLLGAARPIPVSVSLGVIAAVLLVTVTASLRASGHDALNGVS
ncbi:MAG TPA: TerC/Alx family metal homeostasis membrane protein [Gemmatimonadales bacterium]|nr:TerC/Alx family metal homeostasis membrane protein [Gemmatimonadales bacterium]